MFVRHSPWAGSCHRGRLGRTCSKPPSSVIARPAQFCMGEAYLAGNTSSSSFPLVDLTTNTLAYTVLLGQVTYNFPRIIFIQSSTSTTYTYTSENTIPDSINLSSIGLSGTPHTLGIRASFLSRVYGDNVYSSYTTWISGKYSGLLTQTEDIDIPLDGSATTTVDGIRHSIQIESDQSRLVLDSFTITCTKNSIDYGINIVIPSSNSITRPTSSTYGEAVESTLTYNLYLVTT